MQIVANYIGVGGNGKPDPSGWYAAADARGVAQATLQRQVEDLRGLSDSQISALEQRIDALQVRAGYWSDYDSWILKETPPDLE
jgi:hypothetical protein